MLRAEEVLDVFLRCPEGFAAVSRKNSTLRAADNGTADGWCLRMNDTSWEGWEGAYRAERDDWSTIKPSKQIKVMAQRDYFPAHSEVLEIGGGLGVDAEWLTRQGHRVVVLECALSAVFGSRLKWSGGRWASGGAPGHLVYVAGRFPDCINPTICSQRRFDVVYEKGIFHNLNSDAERVKMAEAIALSLKEQALWLSVIGSADPPRPPETHGCLFLTQVIKAVEPYFSVEEIVKSDYGSIKGRFSFNAWYCAFLKR